MEVNGAMRSDDGGESWIDLSDELVRICRTSLNLQSAILTKDTAEGMLDVHAICVSPAAPETAVPGAAHGVVPRRESRRGMADLNIGKHAAHLRYGRDVVVAPWDP